jgi:hypothetical protein
MANDAPPKSAYELAMERLQAQDREAGIETRPLNDDQKKRIADLRQQAKAKIAEIEILRGKSIVEALGDPEKLAEINQHYEIDLQRIKSRVEDDVRRIREND